jgi:hypothetical protein
MDPAELKLWLEELDRTHEQLIEAMGAYESTMQAIRTGEISPAIAPTAAEVVLDSVKLCRGQVEATRQTILSKLRESSGE